MFVCVSFASSLCLFFWFVCFLLLICFLKRDKKEKESIALNALKDGEDLGGNGGVEAKVRIYYMIF